MSDKVATRHPAVEADANFWDGFNCPTEWFWAEDGLEAIGVGEDFVLSISARDGLDAGGSPHRQNFIDNEWRTGFPEV